MITARHTMIKMIKVQYNFSMLENHISKSLKKKNISHIFFGKNPQFVKRRNEKLPYSCATTVELNGADIFNK